jgi:aldehyde dehydrogenase (NAD+)
MSLIPFETRHVFIGGRWRPAEPAGETLPLLNPSDGSLLAEIARGDAPTSTPRWRPRRQALDGPWGRLTAAERGRLLLKMSALVLEQADELARLEALDVGKPVKQGRADAVALARYLEFYGGAADKVHGRDHSLRQRLHRTDAARAAWRHGHIVPWNYPMQIIGRSVGAALAMGNACVLKPAEEACLTALAFAAHRRGGRPAGGRAERGARPGRRSRRGAVGAPGVRTTSRSPARWRWAR